jgi:glutathione synthase/RimK-type ligase-like ATP-grasp enzyme
MTYRIGLIVGMEDDFPPAFIERVNRHAGYHAELVKFDGVREDQPRDYDVIIDRLSHEVPFYRFALKAAALSGTYVINDPFWWSADDKFFGYSVVKSLGVAVPRTVLLPSREYIPAIDKNRSLRNLKFPLDWQGIADYVGFPAILKPADGGGWKNVTKVDNMGELFAAYNDSDKLVMTLQEFIDFDEYIRCLCIGRQMVLPIKYDPKRRCYVQTGKFLDDALEKRVIEDAYKINEALGYDMNSVEFAVKDGIPYAIDFTNPAPDMYRWSLGDPYFEIVVDEMVRFSMQAARERPARRKALEGRPPRATGNHGYLWQHAGMARPFTDFVWVGGEQPGRRAVVGAGGEGEG